MQTVAQLLVHAQERLSFLENPRLEAQILLAHVLQCERATFYTWPEKKVDSQKIENFLALLARREKDEPMAYLLKQKGFWSHEFAVTPDTLIPRPETELLVEKVLDLLPLEPINVADVGTGCGAIACTLAAMRPQWQITAVDICPRALAVAQYNAAKLKLKNISFVRSNWLQALGEMRFTAIVSNPPYLKKGDPHLTKLTYEPYHALVSGSTGLEAFNTILLQAKNHLLLEGYLAFEHGFEQGAAIRALMSQAGFEQINTYHDIAGCERLSVCKLTF